MRSSIAALILVVAATGCRDLMEAGRDTDEVERIVAELIVRRADGEYSAVQGLFLYRDLGADGIEYVGDPELFAGSTLDTRTFEIPEPGSYVLWIDPQRGSFPSFRIDGVQLPETDTIEAPYDSISGSLIVDDAFPWSELSQWSLGFWIDTYRPDGRWGGSKLVTTVTAATGDFTVWLTPGSYRPRLSFELDGTSHLFQNWPVLSYPDVDLAQLGLPLNPIDLEFLHGPDPAIGLNYELLVTSPFTYGSWFRVERVGSFDGEPIRIWTPESVLHIDVDSPDADFVPYCGYEVSPAVEPSIHVVVEHALLLRCIDRAGNRLPDLPVRIWAPGCDALTSTTDANGELSCHARTGAYRLVIDGTNYPDILVEGETLHEVVVTP